MPLPASLPFHLTRSSDAFDSGGITSTTETVHGLLRLDGDALHIQWRLHRSTDHYGAETRTDREVERVREVAVPLEALTRASIRRPWWSMWGGDRLVMTAATLEAFMAISGPEGLSLQHPAQLVLRIARHDRAAALNFAADLELAMSERAMRLASGDDGDELGRLSSG
jgi:hypothetical protein